MAEQSWVDLNDFLAGKAPSLKPSSAYPFGPMGEYDSYNALADYNANTGKAATSTNDAGYKEWVASRVLNGMTPEQYIASENERIGLGPNNLTGNDQGGFAWNPNTQQVMTRNFDSGNAFLDWITIPATFAAMAAGAGALTGAMGGAAAGAGTTGAAYGSIPELGLIADAATANAAIAGGIPASTLSGGAGALTLAGTGAADVPWGANAAKEAGGSMYADPIEGLIDLTNQGLTGEQAIAALSEINPAWTQTSLEFLLNNPSQILSSGGDALKSLFGNSGGSGTSGGSTDLLSMLGKLGAAGLGAYASNEQSNSLTDLANKYQEFGAPSRARYESSMTPGFDPTSIPGYAGALDTASRGILARLSATGGNPFGNPGGLIEANKQIVSGTALPAINEYQRLNANTGFGSSMNAAANIQQNAIGQDANMYNALGYGLNQITQPKQDLASLIKSLQLGGLA